MSKEEMGVPTPEKMEKSEGIKCYAWYETPQGSGWRDFTSDKYPKIDEVVKRYFPNAKEVAFGTRDASGETRTVGTRYVFINKVDNQEIDPEMKKKVNEELEGIWIYS